MKSRLEEINLQIIYDEPGSMRILTNTSCALLISLIDLSHKNPRNSKIRWFFNLSPCCHEEAVVEFREGSEARKICRQCRKRLKDFDDTHSSFPRAMILRILDGSFNPLEAVMICNSIEECCHAIDKILATAGSETFSSWTPEVREKVVALSGPLLQIRY